MNRISKKRWMAALLPLIIAVAFTGCATTEIIYKPDQDEEVYGVWTNDEYVQGEEQCKLVMKPEGWYEQYKSYDAVVPFGQGKFIIEKKWISEDGSTMYWIRKYGGTGDKWELARVSSDGSTYERAFRRSGTYPSERMMNTGNQKYRVFYKN